MELNYHQPEKSRARDTFRRFGQYTMILGFFVLLLGVAFLRKRKAVERVAYTSTIDTVQLNSFNQRAK